MFGCGFSPVSRDSSLRNDIFVDTISDTNGVMLRNALRARFTAETASSAKYVLKVNLSKTGKSYKALELSGAATWQEVRLSANCDLQKDGKSIKKWNESSSSSYAIVRDLVAANAALADAEDNAIRILSEKIVSRVGITIK